MKTFNPKIPAVLVFAILLLHGLSYAQSRLKIRSDGSDIILTIWEGKPNSPATLLLIPGWGGGPTEVLGLGKFLSQGGIPVVILTPRGWHESEGISTFANALKDIETAWNWIRKSDRSAELNLNSTKTILGGYSWGGGMSLAYAARDTSVSKVFSIAGTDHGQFIRQYSTDQDFAAMVDKILTSTAAPEGPIRTDIQFGLNEMRENQHIYGLIENTGKLYDRTVLLVGGWEDGNVTVDNTLLPLYRGLRKSGAEDVTFLTYHSDHSFRTVRDRLHKDLLSWISN